MKTRFEAETDGSKLIFGGNINSDFKLKPRPLGQFKNPKAMKEILKLSLPLIWKYK